MAINPSFDAFAREAFLIGKMVASFGEVELLFGLVASTALGNQNLALRAMYRGRSTGGRIDLADVLMRDAFIKAKLDPIYDETLFAVRYCLKIRNQYAHSHWAHDLTGIYFTNLEDAANRAEGFEYDHKHIDLPILQAQTTFFDDTKMLLLHLGDLLVFAINPKEVPTCPKPPARPLPSLHNPASQHVPHWLSEDGKRRHLERALEAEGHAPPKERPPSVLRLTREEWAAKDAKDARSAAPKSESKKVRSRRLPRKNQVPRNKKRTRQKK